MLVSTKRLTSSGITDCGIAIRLAYFYSKPRSFYSKPRSGYSKPRSGALALGTGCAAGAALRLFIFGFISGVAIEWTDVEDRGSVEALCIHQFRDTLQ